MQSADAAASGGSHPAGSAAKQILIADAHVQSAGAAPSTTAAH